MKSIRTKSIPIKTMQMENMKMKKNGGKKCFFFENFGVLCFLETPVLRFAHLPYYRRIIE